MDKKGNDALLWPTQVKPLLGYKIWIEYEDGESGEIDLSHLAGKGVFKAWDEPGHFEKVHISPHRTIAWDENIDMCADFAYMRRRRIRRTRTRPLHVGHDRRTAPV